MVEDDSTQDAHTTHHDSLPDALKIVQPCITTRNIRGKGPVTGQQLPRDHEIPLKARHVALDVGPADFAKLECAQVAIADEASFDIGIGSHSSSRDTSPILWGCSEYNLYHLCC